ncbi:tetratricopeptide repeat protein [Streptomyces herbicida]|uniref:tetratricopeptide repeat protein n=1 Tax=Streptomyces herbicida TaxID=3065675 RepID=UPI0029307561|nr:tetratricopeptide repeat protein [Streptomyces sp. NEAU-HV9]
MTATVATGVTVWALPSPSTVLSESKAASVARNSPQAGALLRSALERMTKRDSVGAARDYRQVLEIDPTNKFAWYGLGLLGQQRGRKADALAAYEKALETDPSFMSALSSEANLLKSSDPDRAIEILKRGANADPKATSLYLQLGYLLAEQKRNGEAEDAFRHAVAVDPGVLSQVPQWFRGSVGR